MLDKILKKSTLNEKDLAFVHANLDRLTDAQLIRLGFKQPRDIEVVSETKNEEEVVAEKPKRRGRSAAN